jgi:NADH-quinone oxidoreductase subunit M
MLLGSGKIRVRAAYQLFLYTLTGSLLMLVSIFVLVANSGSSNFESLMVHTLSPLIEDLI